MARESLEFGGATESLGPVDTIFLGGYMYIRDYKRDSITKITKGLPSGVVETYSNGKWE